MLVGWRKVCCQFVFLYRSIKTTHTKVNGPNAGSAPGVKHAADRLAFEWRKVQLISKGQDEQVVLKVYAKLDVSNVRDLQE